MVTVRLLELAITLHDDVYEPAEDSLLLARHVAVSPGERVLELGTGTGLAALVAARGGATVIATDLNPRACRLARANARGNGLELAVVRTDMADALAGPFDLVMSNPPYLPTGPDEVVRGLVNRALDGGPRGERVSLRAIEAMARVLAPDGRGLLIVSSLQPVDQLEGHARDHGLTWHVDARERYGLEELWLVRMQPAGTSREEP